MPSMANITVKNAANADVIYVAAAPSAGDKIPAVWTQNAASGIVGQRPKFTLATRDNGKGTGRHVSGAIRFPIVETVGGIPTVTAIVPLSLEGTLPTNVDASLVSEAFIQFGNLIVSALVCSSAADGYAPT
jgi:hypothetical protein